MKLVDASKWNFGNIFWISLVHFCAFLAIFYFSWSALLVCLLGVFFFAPLGINVGYHRLLTHKSFSCPGWVRNSLVTIGNLVGAGPPVQWAAMHRVHHRYSDSPLDPHDSSRGFWYSHVLHLFQAGQYDKDKTYLAAYAPDLLKEPYLVFLDRFGVWLAVAVLPLLYAAGGMSWLLWGGFVRTVLTWHIMWFVNSASHTWGYRNYETRDKTVNCWWVGILAAGEGWHNNHHAQPSCAAHGHYWWEFDQSYLFIRAFELLGLAQNVKRPVLPGGEFLEK